MISRINSVPVVPNKFDSRRLDPPSNLLLANGQSHSMSNEIGSTASFIRQG